MKLNLNDRNPYPIILGFAFLCMLPAIAFGVGGFDAAIHGMWIEGFADLLLSGEIFPRHAPDFYAGYGSYIYMFYPPLSFYLSAPFVAIFSNAENLNYYVVVSSSLAALFFSGIACYHWLKGNYSQEVSLLCALLYMVAPQHLGDFYFNASPSQFWSFVWFPMIMIGIDAITQNKRNAVIKYAIPQALLLLTNIPFAIIFSSFAVIYALIVSPKNSTFRRLVVGATFAFGLAAFYLLPMYFLKSYVNIDGHWSGDLGFDYKEFFMAAESFNFTSEEPIKRIHAFMQVFRLLVIISLVYVLVLFRKSLSEKTSKASLAIIFGSLFMVFALSNFVWEMFPIIQVIQFPGRFIIVSSVFIALIAASYLSKTEDRKKLMIVYIPFLLFSYGFAYARAIDAFPEEFQFNHENKIEYYPNYIPKLEKEQLGYFYDEAKFEGLPKDILDIETGSAAINVTKFESREVELKVSTYSATKVVLRWFYIDGWSAELDGEPITIQVEDSLKTMSIVLEKDLKGKTLRVFLPLYDYEKIGYLISLMTLFMVGLLYFRGRNAKI